VSLQDLFIASALPFDIFFVIDECILNNDNADINLPNYYQYSPYLENLRLHG